MQLILAQNSRTLASRLFTLVLCLIATGPWSGLASAVENKPNTQPTAATPAKASTATLPDQYFRLLEA
ncbi:MAG TPA: hypothetical protein VFJ27_07025, partial [Terriglobia bacterium]|nr:hypothetical protein [Terriglobia bacterium]